MKSSQLRELEAAPPRDSFFLELKFTPAGCARGLRIWTIGAAEAAVATSAREIVVARRALPVHEDLSSRRSRRSSWLTGFPARTLPSGLLDSAATVRTSLDWTSDRHGHYASSREDKIAKKYAIRSSSPRDILQKNNSEPSTTAVSRHFAATRRQRVKTRLRRFARVRRGR